MAVFSTRVCLVTLLVLLGTTILTNAKEESTDDEVTIETVEDDQYVSPTVDLSKVYFSEHFDDPEAFNKRWIRSEAKKQGVDENIAKYNGKWEIQAPSRKLLKNDLGLVLTSEASLAAISALLDRPFEFKDKPLVVQYEITLQEGQSCGGSYIKLLSRGTNTRADLRKFHDQTPYTIMFGPDKCGNDNKLHFIFRHQNPKNGTIEEKHCKKPFQRLEDIYKDQAPHLFTLILRPDNTFSILLDSKEVNSGSLLEDVTPPVNPPEEIPDPDDKKPEDWDEREKIVDPTASKPEDWDEEAPATILDPNAVKPDGWLDNEPDTIPDPEAEKPRDWDEEMDGEWEAPLIDNPACSAAPGCGPWSPPTIPNPNYKGVWRAPLITNPNYKGKWTPRMIPNPHYFKDEHPFKMTPIHAIGFELWSISPNVLFDNLIVTDDPAVAEQYAAMTFQLKKNKIDKEADSVLDRAIKYLNAHPWTYLFVIMVVFLPVWYIVQYCRGEPVSEDKKTDAMTEDDPPRSDAEDEADNEQVSEKQARPRGKAQLEPQEVEPEPTAEEEAEPGEEEVPDSTSDEPSPVDADAAGDGTRKRRVRKE